MMAVAQSAAATGSTRGKGRAMRRWSMLGLAVSFAAIVAGLALPTERYLHPQYGAGYWLGIAGGSLMLLMLVYPLRKRVRAMSIPGSVPFWFRLHMAFGIAGPIAILYHSNFSLGATNSNVALACMLIVAGSGLIGRYLYARIHHGLYGRLATARELAGAAEGLKAQAGSLRLLPGLVGEVEQAEARIGEPAPLVVRPFRAAWRAARESRRLRRLVRDAVAMAAARTPSLQAERERFTRAACGYVSSRLHAARRVAEFEACERLFAAWHILHLPLFVMLLVVGIVHVIAVHVY
jgi:hypothetical protein